MNRFIHCAILLVLAIPALPQSQQVFYHITEENGLSDNHVRCILKDHRGMVWIGTADGLNLMDGSQITIFKHRQNDAHSISNNDIYCLAEDAAGNIWIGTGNGLNRCDARTKTFAVFNCPVSPYGNSETVKSIVIDALQIWCATHGGLFLFNTVRQKFQPCYNTAQNDPNNNNRINAIMLDRQKNLWLCSFDGLWSFDPQRTSFIKRIHAGNDPKYDALITSVLEDHNGHIWAGSWNNGLKELDPQTGKVTNHSLLPGDPYTISCMMEVKQPSGNYVLWLNGALKAYDPATRRFFVYAKPLQADAYQDVSPCYQSADKWIWLASDHGLFVYNPGRAAFHHFVLPGLTLSQSISFAELNGGLLLAAQGKDFCKLYNNQFQVVKDYSSLLKAFPGAEQRQGISALAVLQPDPQHCWIGTSNGIAYLNTVTGENKWMLQQLPGSRSPYKNFITALLLDAQHRFWVFPWRDGIWQLNPANQTMRQVCDGFITEGGKKKPLVIADAAQDSLGNIWMADLDEGIILYENKTGVFSKPFSRLTGERCHSTRVFCRNGYCYSVINNVFTKWRSDGHFYKTYPAPYQMDKQVTDVVPGANGLWWLATRNGLLVFNEKLETFQRFTEADGLRSNDMDGTLFCRSNGQLVFATQQYITTFDPTEVVTAGRPLPATMLTSIEENGRPVTDNSQPLQFRYNANNLFFRWTVTDYADPFHNQYYCKLKGIDADWRYAGNKGEVQYANLSPGQYQLLLRGAAANGVFAKNIVQVLFIIHAPFWKTGWFIAACMLAITLLVYSWYRYRLRQALQLARLRAKISTDLHDDIGSTLSSISILSDMALKESGHATNTGMMKEIKENSVLLMERMDDIVWSINPKNDSLENLLLRIRKFATRLFEARNIDYHISIQENTKSVRLPMDYRQHVYLVMKEAINNLVKYAAATEAQLLVHYQHNLLEVIIKDNGKGFDATAPSTGNGILNMQQRAAMMHAELLIDSDAGNGTTILLRLKIK